MRSVGFGVALCAVFFSGFGAHAQEAENPGVFEKFLNARAPECVPVSAFNSMSTVTELSPAQFQFVRALYVALPPVSRTLPPGDRAVKASVGRTAMLAIIADGQACARFLAPDFILAMLDEVGEGTIHHVGTPVAYVRPIDN